MSDQQNTTAAAALLRELQDYIESAEPQIEFGESVPLERQWLSLGRVCELFQLSPPLVRELARRAGVGFATLWNEVPYYDGHAIMTMHRYVRELRNREISA